MLIEARRLRLGPAAMLRMAGNLVSDWFAGLIPGLDLILDTAVKAHSKNAALLAERAGPAGDPGRSERQTTSAENGPKARSPAFTFSGDS